MQIGDNGKQALEILEIMAYLAPDKIPIESFFSKLAFDEQIIGEEMSWSAVELLNQYSMINLEKGESKGSQVSTTGNKNRVKKPK
jgi:hypothetical protein